MTIEILDLILTAGLTLGTISGCAFAIYLLPWTDADLAATEALGRRIAAVAKSARPVLAAPLPARTA